MSFQTLNNAFGTNKAPASTARILESIIRPSSTLDGGHSTSSLGIEQATALIRVVFNTSLDQFFGIHRWQTKMALHKQKELSDATKNVLQFTFGQEFCRTPAEGENTSPAVLEEELSIWLLIRMLYCAALIRDSPMEHREETLPMSWFQIQLIERVSSR
ncbi:serine/threonine-protein kinase M1 [Puccinia graminis f. sp. tritici]|uniref:Serine/threonine-protein kinase M1 n=1 Tax=Puccinia graminis f. sp. tritici TaxID=56615 RepID=A0A5B0S740_PUCGR|nr:serine/threonine-protein kinase M1 [Puccinia graminis f. sp. tritici]